MSILQLSNKGEVYRLWLIRVGFGDSCFKVVAHDNLRNTAQRVKAGCQCMDKILTLLRGNSHGKTIVCSRHTCYKYLYFYQLPGLSVNVLHCISGKVNK